MKVWRWLFAEMFRKDLIRFTILNMGEDDVISKRIIPVLKLQLVTVLPAYPFMPKKMPVSCERNNSVMPA